ncbi:MAG: WGR domain-containing protein [Chitinophagaceae bacterium]
MTGTYLERHDPARGMARFYTVSLAPTLFGEWALVREWGRIGSAGTVRADWFGSEKDARAACEALAQRKSRRGYRRIGA